jgi:hypothetical protein
MAKRILSDDGEGPLSVTKHIQSFILDEELNETHPNKNQIDESDFDEFELAISRLSNLRYLSWGLDFKSRYHGLISVFQQECPNLEYIRVATPCAIIIWESDYDS